MVHVTVTGELDAATVRGLAVLLECAIGQRPRNLVIDLADCPSADASTLELLVETNQRTWRAGGLLTLQCPSPLVRRILEKAGADRPLHITPVATFQPSPGVPAAASPAALAVALD
jgi:anti-anti-sigma factor